MTALLVCPDCHEPGEIPCVHVFVRVATDLLATDDAATRIVRRIWRAFMPPPMALRDAIEQRSRFLNNPVALACLLTSDVTWPWVVFMWPAVLAAARAHDGDGCDPVECDACISKASVLQINCWYWQTLEQVASV